MKGLSMAPDWIRKSRTSSQRPGYNLAENWTQPDWSLIRALTRENYTAGCYHLVRRYFLEEGYSARLYANCIRIP
ncbi:MAG: hypothetical protein R3F33_00975 [Planctomycetota bacterium]